MSLESISSEGKKSPRNYLRARAKYKLTYYGSQPLNKIYRKKIGATSWDSYDLPSTGSWSFVGVQGYPDVLFSYNDYNFAKKFEDNLDIFFSENFQKFVCWQTNDG